MLHIEIDRSITSDRLVRVFDPVRVEHGLPEVRARLSACKARCFDQQALQVAFRCLQPIQCLVGDETRPVTNPFRNNLELGYLIGRTGPAVLIAFGTTKQVEP